VKVLWQGLIPIDIDDELRIEAVKKRVRFSDMAILAFRKYLQGGRYVENEIPQLPPS
jgi:hypothetical protein